MKLEGTSEEFAEFLLRLRPSSDAKGKKGVKPCNGPSSRKGLRVGHTTHPPLPTKSEAPVELVTNYHKCERCGKRPGEYDIGGHKLCFRCKPRKKRKQNLSLEPEEPKKKGRPQKYTVCDKCQTAVIKTEAKQLNGETLCEDCFDEAG